MRTATGACPYLKAPVASFAAYYNLQVFGPESCVRRRPSQAARCAQKIISFHPTLS